jgi:hypothetical protein
MACGGAASADFDGAFGALPAAPASSSSALSFPSMNGFLAANPKPTGVDLGTLGTVNVTGVFSGYGVVQDRPISGDRTGRVDFSNLQVFIQKTDGPLQFYVQAGIYAIPIVGVGNQSAIDTTTRQFGPVPVAYGKLQITDEISIQGGNLNTLIGYEAAFTFQNINIQRGLLFNQTNVINRGVQANYNSGPLTVSASLNDGFYSGELTWFTGLVSYKFDQSSTLTFDAGANLGRTRYTGPATPLLQNNSSMFNLIYSYTTGPWIVAPYVQYTDVARDPGLGIPQGASTYGGALLVSYALTPEFALGGRFEYLAQSGRPGGDAASLLYGPGSSAVSVAVTPTLQLGRFFLRGEYAYVQAIDAATGSAFGRQGNRTSQNRFALEGGIIF